MSSLAGLCLTLIILIFALQVALQRCPAWRTPCSTLPLATQNQWEGAWTQERALRPQQRSSRWEWIAWPCVCMPSLFWHGGNETFGPPRWASINVELM